jgi:hypothetical protein
MDFDRSPDGWQVGPACDERRCSGPTRRDWRNSASAKRPNLRRTSSRRTAGLCDPVSRDPSSHAALQPFRDAPVPFRPRRVRGLSRREVAGPTPVAPVKACKFARFVASRWSDLRLPVYWNHRNPRVTSAQPAHLPLVAKRAYTRYA